MSVLAGLDLVFYPLPLSVSNLNIIRTFWLLAKEVMVRVATQLYCVNHHNVNSGGSARDLEVQRVIKIREVPVNMSLLHQY